MNKDYIHISLCIDASGSMLESKSDVEGGIKSLIDEQRKNKDGKVTLSLYTFNSNVQEVFVGRDVNEEFDYKYETQGLTRMNDGIALAIDKTGKWLSDMKEEERPGKVMVYVFTDGYENASQEFKLQEVKEKIKHQEEKYNWTFVFMGTNITTTKSADDLGFKFKTYSSRGMMSKNYDVINCVTSAYRSLAASASSTAESINLSLSSLIDEETTKNTKDYEKELGRKIDGK